MNKPYDTTRLNLLYTHAIRFPDGTYFNGNLKAKDQSECTATKPMEVFTYTPKGAEVRLGKRDTAHLFEGATIVPYH